jgi:hypothetical protein
MKARFAAQLLALTLILCAPLACNAAIVELTWSGVTAFGGNDGLGLFGPAGAMPADVSYQAKFRYDTTVQFVENGTNGSEEVKGGLFYGSPSPLVSASVTINGQTLGMGGEYAGEYFRQSGQGASNVSTLAQRAIPGNPTPYGGELFQRVFRGGDFYGKPLPQPADLTFTASDSPSGEVLYFNRDAMGNLSGPTTQIQLIPAALSIRVVPEPHTAGLALSLVAVGGARIRRRRMPPPAYTAAAVRSVRS